MVFIFTINAYGQQQVVKKVTNSETDTLYALVQEKLPFSHTSFNSIRYQQSRFFNEQGINTEQAFDSLNILMYGKKSPIAAMSTPELRQSCNLQQQVYGWHPFWLGASTYNNYQYDLLSTLSYFSYELNPSTGAYNDIHFWKTTDVINQAKAAGCKVELSVTNFGHTANTTFLSNTTAWDVLVDSLKVLLDYRDADGVNLDFEGIPASQGNNFNNFVAYFSDRIKNERPGTDISIALFAVDWNNVYNIAWLNNYVDTFVIMGYDYHYSGDTQAGPVAPLYHGNIWSTYTLNRTVDTYLNNGVPTHKLLLAIPYYGYDWQTTTTNVPAVTSTTGEALTYQYIRNNFTDTYSYRWDQHSQTPYFIYTEGGYHRQCWYDDYYSLAKRYDMVNQKQLGGVGIWALGYDNGYNDLWQLLSEKFTDCNTTQTGFAYDSSGDLGNYRNNENMQMTFSTPSTDVPVKLRFWEFDVETDYDYVYLYDGVTTNPENLVATYTGSNIPPAFTSNSNAITLKFTSDTFTTAQGWKLHWQSVCEPQTVVNSLNNNYVSDFDITFTDINPCNLPLETAYYQTAYNSNELQHWHANGNKGFLRCTFTTPNTLDIWDSYSGTWSISANAALQTDEDNTNTNLSIPLQQSSDKQYLYHWKAKMGGTGNNRRAGVHFMCSEASSTNRGNSYFAFFRVDDNKVQLYKVINNEFELLTNDYYPINANQWYDFKVTFNPATGQLQAFVDNNIASSYTDSTPHTSGSYVSLRTANCVVHYDYILTYTNRNEQVTASIGDGLYNDFTNLDSYINVASISLWANKEWSNMANTNAIINDVVEVGTNNTVGEYQKKELFKFYPNPVVVGESIYLKHTDNYNQFNNCNTCTISIFNIKGQQVFYQNNLQQINNIRPNILTPGTYVICVTRGDELLQSTKLIVH